MWWYLIICTALAPGSLPLCLAKPWTSCISTPDCSPDSRLMRPTACLMFRRHLYLISKTELSVSPQTSSSCSLPISLSGSSVFVVAQARPLDPHFLSHPFHLQVMLAYLHTVSGIQFLLTTSAFPAFSEPSSSPSRVIRAIPCLPTSTPAPPRDG